MAKLFYLIGPSGAGKDSVIQQLKQQLSSQAHAKQLLFAHRYINRPASAGGENHIALTEAEFAYRLAQDLFAMHWQANDLNYGIGLEIDVWLASEHHVMVNGSREYLPEAIHRYGELLVPVLLQVEDQILAQRLRLRGREDELAIQKRLQRAQVYRDTAITVPMITLDNSGALDNTVEQFLQQFAVFS